ncbi:restriction endonuclease subunit S [Sphingobacterium siyangense]|uniref:restriction endonuclease subunit S n=1 Tax=Sphingobacterium siyangense TaxID=459529 RepID=UPI002FD92D3C
MQRYEKYKDSGIDWLGEIPEHWEDRKLGNILSPYSVKNRADLPLLSITREKGVIHRGEDPEDDNHNFIPDDLSGYKHLKVGQFGMNKMKAWQGSYGYSNFEGIVSPAYYIFDISSNLFGEYFSKTIRSKAYIPFFTKASDGVRIGQWDLSKPRMKEIPFYVPPLAEQKAITKFLNDKCEKIDAAVILKERQIEKLKELRQITIHNAVTKGISHFNGEVIPTKDSGIDWIGEIPEHWEVKRLKRVLKAQGRIGFKGYSTSDLVGAEEGALVLGASHMDWNGSLKLNDPVYLSWHKYYESPEIMVNKGDIVIVQRGSTCGKVSLIVNDLGSVTINPSLVLLKNISINNFFCFLAIKCSLQYILGLMSKTAIPMISQEQINNISVPIPRLTEQEEIAAYLKKEMTKIDKAIVQRQEQIVKLKEYKQSLINEAVTGKIKIIA